MVYPIPTALLSCCLKSDDVIIADDGNCLVPLGLDAVWKQSSTACGNGACLNGLASLPNQKHVYPFQDPLAFDSHPKSGRGFASQNHLKVDSVQLHAALYTIIVLGIEGCCL